MGPIVLPLYQPSPTPKNSRERAVFPKLSSHRSHDFGIKGTPTLACDVPGRGVGKNLVHFRNQWDPRNRVLLASPATKC